MANVNINRNLSDQFYRYKMPKLLAKVEGKGNGIKTVIVNMPEIAKSLNRPPMYPTKYFGCLLGAQVNFDSKSERYIVNGAHDPNKLQDLLDGFIQKYVLCQSCENPETQLSVNKKKEIIGTNCMACGHSGTIPVGTDRVAAYILKNPPPKPAPITAPTAAAAAAAAESAAILANDIKSAPNNDDDDEDWGEETNEAAVRERMDQLSAGAKSLMLNDDLEKTQDERLSMFFEFVENKVKKNVDLTLGENQQAIKAEAERLDISDKAVIVLCEVLFKDDIMNTIPLYKNLFLRFTNQNPKAQKYLLRALEMTITLPEYKDQLLPRVEPILYKIYNNDIIDEEVLCEWFAKHKKRFNKLDASMKTFVNNATKFIDWLQSVSTETESGDEEEQVDVDFDDRLVGDAIKVTDQDNSAQKNSSPVNAGRKNAQAAAATPAAKGKPDEDEIDIDAI